MDTDTKEALRTNSGAIYVWTDQAIHSEALHMPEPLRPDYIWLKIFTRDQCARDVDVLVEKLRALGHAHDKTTIAKIIRGRYQRNAAGNPTAHPVISADAFVSIGASLRDGVRAEALRGRVPFVETETSSSIFAYIGAKRAEDRVNKFGFIVGHTGTGKSATFHEYCRRHNHGLCSHVEAPESGIVGEFITILAMKFGFSANLNRSAKRTGIFAALGAGDHRTRSGRTIIVDNCQDLYRSGHQEQQAFSFLRRLQDVTGCTVILSITPTFERTLMNQMMSGYFEQFEGRSGGRDTWLRLPEHPPDADVLAIARAFGVENAKAHTKELARIARQPGRIRRLFEVLQDAKLAAEAERIGMTIDVIREICGGAA